MPKILITGNGFDLNIGLPTAYIDFINILNYIDNESDLTFDKLYNNSINKSKIQDNFDFFEFDETKIIVIKQISSNNIWFQFFKSEFKIESWIDFETKIDFVLKYIIDGINTIRKYLKSNPILKDSSVILFFNSTFFNNNIVLIETLKTFKIICEEKNEYYFNISFLIEKYDFYIDVDSQKIVELLIDHLNNFRLLFNLYLETFVLPLLDKYKQKDNNSSFQKIDFHYTFNYTPTFNYIYESRIETDFLHGKVDSISNQIVLGVDDINFTEIDKKLFYPFTKYYQKIDFNTDFKFLKEHNLKDRDNVVFYFLGHSLDKSDEEYVNEVFDFINDLKAEIKKIVVVYNREKGKLLSNLFLIRGREQILSFVREEILVFVKNNSDELEKELNIDIRNKTYPFL